MTAASLSAATIDSRLAPERMRYELKGRSLTKPGTLLQSQIPIRTWVQWDDPAPGFVEINLVGHEGGNAVGEHAIWIACSSSLICDARLRARGFEAWRT